MQREREKEERLAKADIEKLKNMKRNWPEKPVKKKPPKPQEEPDNFLKEMKEKRELAGIPLVN